MRYHFFKDLHQPYTTRVINEEIARLRTTLQPFQPLEEGITRSYPVTAFSTTIRELPIDFIIQALPEEHHRTLYRAVSQVIIITKKELPPDLEKALQRHYQ